MEQRRKLAFDVLECGLSLSEACRQFGVTRKTGRKWVERARTEGLEAMTERSHATTRVHGKTDPAIEEALVKLKGENSVWGPRKLVVLLERDQGIRVPVRTAERIMARHGLTNPRPAKAQIQHFERESCGALLQMDFKGLPRGTPYSVLTVLDDHARYCLGFGPVPDKTGPTVQAFLWDLFGTHGLPDSMLMDNGDCWGAIRSWSPTAFESWLMRLGIKPIHGKPNHPQTQGKVERFHRTAKLEIGSPLYDPNIAVSSLACQAFVQRYNWVRPHDALASDVPGSRYALFPRKRPSVLPTPEPRAGDLTRKVGDSGCITFKQRGYKVGRGLVGQHVQLRQDEGGLRVFYADFPLAYLSELGPSRTFGEI